MPNNTIDSPYQTTSRLASTAIFSMTPSSASMPHEVDDAIGFIEEAEESTKESGHQKYNDGGGDDDDDDGGIFVIYDETASPNAIVDESGGGMMNNHHGGIEDISNIVLNGPDSVDDWSPCLQVRDDGFGSIHV
jgi:hypothetical protein